jgi:hypothetical protein
MERERRVGRLPLLAWVALCASASPQAQATDFTYVTIPANNNIQTALFNTFPTGTFIANNALATPFNIPSAAGKCEPSGASPCNYYDGFGFLGSGKSITMDISIASPTDVYTLMNGYKPAVGQQLATIQFVGSGGVSLTFPLIGGHDIRDYNHSGIWANSLTNGITGVKALNAFACTDPTNCIDGTGVPANLVVDEQHFSLGTAFAGQTLTQIIITDTYNGSNPILLGVTVGSASAGIPAIASDGVVSGASFQAGIVPGSWITIFGTNFSSITNNWANAIVNGNLPTSLDGVKVSVGGEPAYVYYISPTQIDVVAPNLATGTVAVTVTNSSGTSAPVNAVVQKAEPSFFQWGNYAVATSPSAPAGVEVPSGTTYNTADTASVTVGGIAATVYGTALAPGFAGLYQVAIQIPASLANGDYPVIATISSAQSPSTTLITVQE